MRSLLILLFVSSIALSCTHIEGYSFNEKLVGTENALIDGITETENSVSAFAERGSFDSIVLVSAALELRFDSAIRKVQALRPPDAKEAAAFQRVFVDYLKYLKSIYTAYRRMGAASDEDRPAQLNHLVAVVGRKDSVMATMQRAQKKFADAYGFKIEN